MQDPETQLKGLGLELPGIVDPNTKPVLEIGHRTIVNGQFYWASDDAELELFRKAPYQYTGPLRDPLTGEWFSPTSSSPSRSLGGQLFYFASEHTAEEFDQAPEAHLR